VTNNEFRDSIAVHSALGLGLLVVGEVGQGHVEGVVSDVEEMYRKCTTHMGHISHFYRTQQLYRMALFRVVTKLH
jgi:hypothetical protein